jgi:hypothetical protein
MGLTELFEVNLSTRQSFRCCLKCKSFMYETPFMDKNAYSTVTCVPICKLSCGS